MSENEKYDSKVLEPKMIKFWKENHIYRTDIKSLEKNKQLYSIDTPPPTVSGKMHIGHAFSYSQQDFIARFRRMYQGVFYPFGTDDNGLPTERLIEKIKGVKSKDMTRADFIELCLKTLKEVTPDFVNDWEILGISADFEKIYSTIDKNSQRLSQKSFLDLYKNGDIYNKNFPTLWCPECQTSIAQAELEDKEIPSLFSTIKFKVNNSDLLIATTRPELLPACVAVFVNPKDARHKKIIGKEAVVPIFNHKVPIIADDSADMKKGTGVLMICSYGDKFDVDAIQKHKLTPRVILTPNGTLNSLAKNYENMKIPQARKKILEDLKKEELIVEQKSISHMVNTHDKCGTPIEFISTEQWFIKILDKKNFLIEQGKKINWYPEHMYKRYENWVSGLDWDWSISRDRHFGIPIPVWYCKSCKEIIVADEKELPIDPLQISKTCPKCKKKAVPEEKVLDTWATSSISPQLSSLLTENKVKMPYSLRPQAHDIIRTWAFYTIAKAYMHQKVIPWKDIMISGFVTLSGEKMSKSKGNVISPQSVMEKFSADTLRFWAAGSKLGEDLNYQEQDLVAGNKFITKLWNASRFVFMNLQGFSGKKPKELYPTDKEFLSSLDYLIQEVTKNFLEYNYSQAKSKVESFFWKDFCDDYLEIVKYRIYNGNEKEKSSAQYVLRYSLLNLLKLMAPITPFVTEHIYQTLFEEKSEIKSIHISKWPESSKSVNSEEFLHLQVLREVVKSVRQKKSENNKSVKAEIILTIPQKNKALLEEKGMIQDLKTVTNSREIKTGEFSVVFVE